VTTITAIFTGVAAHIAKYADAVVVSSGGGTQILVSGTPGLREDGTPPEEFTEARQCWANIENALAKAGAGVGDEQRRLAAGRADVGRVDRPDQRSHRERHWIRPT
jgi:enamine deaminase RidA (YjgF/YER057c/UK114 family)